MTRLKSHSRRGMTMVELVSALMIFIFILGGLTLALNKVTRLWSSSHTGQYEQEKADMILSRIGEDLQQAVTDNAPITETGSEAPPTLLSDATPIQNAGDLRFILQLVRHPPRRSVLRDDDPPALEAVFYTFYRSALFRHAVPLKYSDPDNPEHIGELLAEAAARVDDGNLHSSIIDYTADPSLDPPEADWSYSLLAQRIEQPVVLAGIASQYADAAASEEYNRSFELSNSLRTLPEYLKLETRVLPDYLFVALRIFNEYEWAEYEKLISTSDQELKERKEPYLGKYVSRRYSFMTVKGARLK